MEEQALGYSLSSPGGSHESPDEEVGSPQEGLARRPLTQGGVTAGTPRPAFKTSPNSWTVTLAKKLL